MHWDFYRYVQALYIALGFRILILTILLTLFSSALYREYSGLTVGFFIAVFAYVIYFSLEGVIYLRKRRTARYASDIIDALEEGGRETGRIISINSHKEHE